MSLCIPFIANYSYVVKYILKMEMESHVIAHYSHASFHLVNEYLHFDGLPTTAHYSHASFHLVDEYLHFDGLPITRESMIRCGLSLDTNGRWQIEHFSFIFARHHEEIFFIFVGEHVP